MVQIVIGNQFQKLVPKNLDFENSRIVMNDAMVHRCSIVISPTYYVSSNQKTLSFWRQSLVFFRNKKFISDTITSNNCDCQT